jgi:hypothetical protein
MLTRMGASSGELIVEGTFDKNLAVCQTLGALRPKQRWHGACGAAMLAHWPPAYPIAVPTKVPIAAIAGLDGYREAWTATVNLVAR